MIAASLASMRPAALLTRWELATQVLIDADQSPIDMRSATHKIRSTCGSLGDARENRTEVQCPRATLAAMIAAASFGSRRSGRLGERHRRERPIGPHQ